MIVTVKTFATLRRFMEKEAEVTVEEGTTAGELLLMLSAAHPGLKSELFDENGELRKYVNILKNGRNIHFLKKLGTVLEEDDLIAIFPPSGGG
ncbi:MoaD/ThiS family protein [Methanogenium sp. S4BF]|uniref:ubiquitin-like small modifier protein 1 n=1 Tax=Methanogenium sp. S4BF TaxID=1789226 RepID=UPI00241608B9|nr:ubiquitin-like small modifier protein 1 [Methanogenium sp. S4BF]WFN35588.1 MoaD/ThiS family protein [Methanogenium sp. S4BF]